jgi:KDO2-lipid IV(A) lauroyltransferase
MKKLRHIVEYLALRPLIMIVDILPLRTAVRFASALASLYFALDLRRRPVAIDNIIKSGIETDPARAADMAKQSYRSFAALAVESLKSKPIMDAQDLDANLEVHISPELEALLDDEEQGIILATGHLGSWELAAQVLSTRKPVAGVTRGMNNALVDRWMQKRKPRHNFYLMPKYEPGKSGRFMEVLKKGHILALMIDVHAHHRGMMIDFFGRPASTYTAIALLHLVTGTPLCFGYCRRTGEMKYEINAVGPIRHKKTGNKEDDIRAVLTQLTQELETAVRKAPEQYLWAHRRWRRAASGS